MAKAKDTKKNTKPKLPFDDDDDHHDHRKRGFKFTKQHLIIGLVSLCVFGLVFLRVFEALYDEDVEDEKLSAAKYFELLGVDEGTPLKEIEKKFRDISKKHHPDRCDKETKAQCQEKYAEYTKAFEEVKKQLKGKKESKQKFRED
eukprot:TRINITY_DN6560_c0_g1_i1.p1 TRINITY_DN6560_c0_g1~~TRINITY_DN6560_c0_g1_i1.p1  ORF type:complete len:145 (-),score=53.14 TRINITY_DN6560_c0_g1_i1:166-600(-)